MKSSNDYLYLMLHVPSLPVAWNRIHSENTSGWASGVGLGLDTYIICTLLPVGATWVCYEWIVPLNAIICGDKWLSIALESICYFYITISTIVHGLDSCMRASGKFR